MPQSLALKSLSRRLPLDSWQVFQALTPRFSQISLQQHESYEFYLHVSNGGAFQVDERKISLQPYQLLVIPPRQTHGLVGNEPRLNYERLTVLVHPRVLSQLTFGDTSLMEIINQHCQTTDQQIFVSPLEYLYLKEIASFVPSVKDAVTPLDRIEALGFLSVMLSRFCRIITSSSSTVHTSAADTLMQDVHNYIQARFAEDCSLNTLSARFNVSKYHLSRRFSETYGMSLHHFVLRCRVSYAQILIRQGESMMNVFELCGFNDYSSFVRAFDHITGMNPRAWRSQQRAAALRAPEPEP